MKKVRTKHFQYTGLDDYDKEIDVQINEFLDAECITSNRVISLNYSAHSSGVTNIYTALLLYAVE
ncbi:MAG: hypothetical protein LBV41_04620 [Cytophagaceae bacterium]|jgi:predicted nucleic-acid-binding Zn-ribbon protein|nr:hypothetical protein [Cytophagaceae bacterium]